MSKKVKIWLVVASFLVILGSVMFAGAMTANSWDFKRLNTVNYESVTYPIEDNFSDIVICTCTEDIVIAPSGDGICKVVCYGPETGYSVSVKDGTLSMETVKSAPWYESPELRLSSASITLYLPEKEYGALSITDTTGDISAESLSFKNDIVINVTTGNLLLKDIQCGDLVSSGSTGDVLLTDVYAAKSISIDRSTGDIRFVNCDGNELSVRAETGNVSGNLLSDKTYVARTSTGDISVPDSQSGGRCEITTSTGDISFRSGRM